MRIGGIEVKRRIWISPLFALAATVVWWLWTGSKLPVPPSNPVPKQPAVRIARSEIILGDNVLREQAKYFDPSPLFFPTEWNYGQGALRESMKRQPGEIFTAAPPKFIFSEQNIKLDSDEVVAISGNLADVVSSGNEAPYAGIGEGDLKPVEVSSRGGFLEITNLGDGKTIIAQTLAEIPGLQADFPPLEFLIAVSPAGLVADPVLMTGSGREEVEVFLRTYLAKTLHVGERLSPGMYRILIGP